MILTNKKKNYKQTYRAKRRRGWARYTKRKYLDRKY